MAQNSHPKRVFLLGNPAKPDASAAMEKLRAFAAGRCEVVGAETGVDGRVAIEAGADMIVVFGGDGTLLGVARSLGLHQIPLVGVNLGKLGFLADFLVEELQFHFDRVISDDSLVTERMILDVRVFRDGGEMFSSLAINDCVIQAGPPFRIIELSVWLNSRHLTDVAGDGIIVGTPSGSTAFNMSAGGPIVQSGVRAFVLTPLNAHSLTHRPMVIEHDSFVDIHAKRVNEGSAAIVDGQVSRRLLPKDRVHISRSDVTFKLVHNPMYPRWHKLVNKLGWGRSINS
jgi:NAD+ kinase